MSAPVIQTTKTTSRSAPASGIAAGATWIAALVIVVHLVTNIVTPYGIHRDELLYLAMGRHLRLFQMDFPPMIAILAELSRRLGDSLVAIRLGPALSHAAIVLLAALLARRFGGGRFAQLLAAGSVAVAPIYMRPGALFQPVTFDQLWWTAGLLVLSRIPILPRAGAASTVDSDMPSAAREVPARFGRTRWILLGVVIGLGLLTKFSIAFFGFGVLVGLVLTPYRRWLLTPWPWIAAGLSFAIGSPSLVGQLLLGFPVRGQMRDLAASQLERIGYLDFVVGQALILGPAIILAVAGFVRLVTSKDPGARVVGWSCAGAFGILMLLHGKPYYAGPIYPALIAAGSVVVDRVAGDRLVGRIGRGVAVAIFIAFPLLLLPFGLPILPPAPMAAYAARMGLAGAVTTNRGEVLELPQDYADMLGWEAQAAEVARVYRTLSPEDRSRVVVVAENYGEAGALDFYGPKYGLPQAIAPVGSYWYFGPGKLPGDVVIKIGGTAEDLRQFFRSVEPAGRVDERWVVPEERDLTVWLCRGPYRTVQQLWPMFEGEN